MRTKAILVLSLLLFAFSASTFANDLYQDGIIYDFKDFAVFASRWMDANCSQPDWCNGCDFANSFQGLLRKIAELILDGLQDRDHRLRAASDLFNQLIDY